MNGITRINQCGNCFHKTFKNGQLECREGSPKSEALIVYTAKYDLDGKLTRMEPQIAGFVSHWPIVQADQSCGQHSAHTKRLIQ